MEYIKRIRDLREDNDKTQTEIAEYLGTSQTMYARYERGANELPIRHLLALCKYYNVSADYLLCISDVKQRADEPTAANISNNERKLLNAIRSLPCDKQNQAFGMIFELLNT